MRQVSLLPAWLVAFKPVLTAAPVVDLAALIVVADAFTVAFVAIVAACDVCNKVSATVSNTTDAAVQKTGEVKTAATTALKTEVKAVKETAAGTSASGSGSVQANSSANVAVSKQ